MIKDQLIWKRHLERLPGKRQGHELKDNSKNNNIANAADTFINSGEGKDNA